MLITHAVTILAVAIGQDAAKLPRPEELLPFVPTLSTRHEAVRSFAFDIVHFTPVVEAAKAEKCTESLRTRGWYGGPDKLALIMLDDADDTPLFYAADGKGIVYDAWDGRCITFDYGSLNCFFLLQNKQSLMMGTNMNPAKGGSRFDFDLRSLFGDDNLMVSAAGPGAFQLSARGTQATASIRIAPKESQPWGQFTLAAPKDSGPEETMLAIDLVDYNRNVSFERLAFPALKSSSDRLRLTPFPQEDADLNEIWKAALEGFKRNAPPDLQANFKVFNTPEMKAIYLAQLVVRRTHFVRMALRHPAFREKLKTMEGNIPIVNPHRPVDWHELAARDRTVAAAVRDLLTKQTPLRQPPPTPAELASAEQAKKWFEDMQHKLAQAKGYKVDFDAEILTSLSFGVIKGNVTLAPGNRMKLSYACFLRDGPNFGHVEEKGSQTLFVSDGKTFVVTNGFQAKPTTVEPVKEDYQKTLSDWGFRIGLFYTMGRLNQSADQDDRTAIKTGDFKSAGQEKVNERLAHVIEFTLTKYSVPTYHKLWIDTETGLPLKLVVRTREGMGCSETYRNWRLAPFLPAETFDLPK